MKVEPYLFFEGNCEEAMQFYKRALGATEIKLMRYKESDVLEVPGIGSQLHAHLKAYYGFQQAAAAFEDAFLARIATVRSTGQKAA